MKSKKLIFITAASVLFIIFRLLGTFDAAEQRAYDRFFKQPGVVDPRIYVFGIDEETLIEFGPVQNWARQKTAEAIEILNTDPMKRPAVIAVDMLYSGLSVDEAADEALVKAAENGGNVIFGAQVAFDRRGGIRTFEKPFEALEKVSAYGILNPIIDPDGVVRKTSSNIEIGGVYEPTFAFALYEMFTGVPAQIPSDIEEPIYISYTGEIGDYYGAVGLGTSFSDIFNENFDPRIYAGDIIIIGPYAAGLMDSYSTPVDTQNHMHGVEIHANILQMLLDENYKRYVPLWQDAVLLSLLLAVFCVVLLLVDIRLSVLILAGFAITYLPVAKWFYGQGIILTLVYPMVSIAVLYIVTVIYDYISERAEKRRIKSMFKKYVDPGLVDKLMKQTDITDSAVGEVKHFAVLFVDIRGFTQISESLKDNPETIVQILNDYLELTTECVFANGGSVDKFAGDSTMALFNGFTPLDDYVYKAAAAALDMVKRAEALNKQISDKHGIDIGFGIGIHCGNAVVGNIGPHFRKDFTAIGDMVNTAARLESNAKASQILISRDVCDALSGRIDAESAGKLHLKGKGAFEAFELKALK